jgi:hypothetical protein
MSRHRTSGDAGYRRSSYPEPRRQIPPRAAGPGPEEDPVDHHPVIGPVATARRIGGQESPQPLPFLIRQIMTIQPLKHRNLSTSPDYEDPRDTP